MTFILAVVVALNVLLTFGLLARVRTLQELVVGRAPDLPVTGVAVGPFEAAAANGEVLSPASLVGPLLVGFFSPGCKPCERVKAELGSTPPPLPMLAFVLGSDADARSFGDALRSFARVAYTDDDEAVLGAFGASAYPTLIRVENGIVAAAGRRLADVLP